MIDRRVLVASLALSSACLFPSLDDLSSSDASVSDALTETASDASIDVAGDNIVPGDASTDAGDASDASWPTKPAPIAFHQMTVNEFNSGNTALVSLPNVAPHDSIIVGIGMDATATFTITDSLGGTYAQFVAYHSSYYDDYIWAAFNVVGGNDTVTVTTTTSHTGFEVYMLEYAGLSDFDVQASASGTGTGTDNMTSGFATTTFGNDLILGFGEDGAAVAGTGFTLRSGFEEDIFEDRIVSTAGSYQATASMQSGVSWQISMAAFKGF